MTTATTQPLHDPVPTDSHVAGASLPARVYGSKHVHRLLPAPVALGLAARLGPALRQRRNPAERRAARRFMTDLLLHTPRASEAEELAERWLAEKARLRELFWRPWLLRRSRIIDRQHWDDAHATGRGCVIALGHIGATWAVPRILEAAGLGAYIVSAAHYWEPLPSGYEGLERLHRRREYTRNRTILMLRNDGPPERLLELVERGSTVGIAFDVGGSAVTPFLGRSVSLAGGLATLATRTGAAVLGLVPERTGSRIDLRVLEPIDSTAFDSTRSLRAAIARSFEPAVLARPEAVELAWYPSPLVTEVPPGELG